MKISIVIPTYNEERIIGSCLAKLLSLREEGHEVIVVDGGSSDKTVEYASSLCDQLIQSSKGRAAQMNTGAMHASGDILLFLHADTLLPENIDQILGNIRIDDNFWGRFDVKISGKHWLYRVIESMINLRSRMSGIATGDQCIFVSRQLYTASGGIPVIELMEDIAFSKRLKKITGPVCLKETVITSSRRWENNGILKTIFTMWLIRGLYFLGISPARLIQLYV